MTTARTAEEWGDLAEEVGHDLLGTCNTLDRALEARDAEGADNVMAFCNRLDAVAWECKACGWWVEPHEVDDDERCEQCQEEDGE